MINAGIIFFAIASLWFAWKNVRKHDSDGCLFNIMCDIALLAFWFAYYGATTADRVNFAVISAILGIDIACYVHTKF
jgi:hypothetical protein